ncbi:DUF6909 family protein [Pontibacter sp. G13]|uniref:DUF6909 family protein n=1 Tax=Pontibacter sp. G13 TaxID=3074898 RepID=UPI00288B20C3|nr:hypothetical protein [Pontibacter sp. G13]WNJ18890.1 hypothetical protein RJD25_00240 [Pontibacter sp. G13]
MEIDELQLTRARESRAAIERLYIEMRHVFNSGLYRQLGQPGEVLTQALHTLSPEIYGSMGNPDKVELDGLVYVIDRLPKGIEQCRYIKLTSEEGYASSSFERIVPAARRRNCYRIDDEHMFIEVTRGRSEIYDILTHLTFLYIEADKIMSHALTEEGTQRVEWTWLESIVQGNVEITEKNREIAFTFLSTLLGRSFAKTKEAWHRMNRETNSGLFKVVYYLGKLAMNEAFSEQEREITFSPTLRDRIGHHIYGERWASNIKQTLAEFNLLDRPLHIISSNVHSVLNSIYAPAALHRQVPKKSKILDIVLKMAESEHPEWRSSVKEYAFEHGFHELHDRSGTNITVQIIDTAKLDLKTLSNELKVDAQKLEKDPPVILVMDYAFGEQAYETMDELLKPIPSPQGDKFVRVASISIMGKAGILEGGKGDIMIPDAHVFEGTADNYPFDNDLTEADFSDIDVKVLGGAMITVLGTSLQNRDVLAYFKNSSWRAIGLEMEGAHYQKAIQAASKIRKSIERDVVLRYAYYASDNPLETGSTLASGSLGQIGIKPTYTITRKILEKILS